MKKLLIFLLSGFILLSCKKSGEEQMLEILQQSIKKFNTPANIFALPARLHNYDSLLKHDPYLKNSIKHKIERAEVLILLGRPFEASQALESVLNGLEIQSPYRQDAMEILALAYLRIGEQNNCIANHFVESCIFPIRGRGVHVNPYASNKAIEIYSQLLRENMQDYHVKWLLNIAYMTTGGYPSEVPKDFLIPNLDIDSNRIIQPFQDIAPSLNIVVNNQAGGSITEDFDNDGYLDLVTSSMSLDEPMHYFHNNADGTFSDHSEKSGLRKFVGGLNMVQTDYNNDGFKDIFVLRGGWQKEYGNQPNSLLKNNGDGTFTDVTIESGLLSSFPTNTATWNDFNNDGWLDVFIGNESILGSSTPPNWSEFYLNNQDGTFTEIAEKAGCKVEAYVKGVVSGDYDNDGKTDIYISTLNGYRILLKNKTNGKGEILFEDITSQAFPAEEKFNSFSTFFWDYNNDGWIDILVNDYTIERPLSFYHGSHHLDKVKLTNGRPVLYKNNKDGTFSNVTEEVGLNRPAFSMGTNFGDIDNDGFLDIYLSTGDPNFRSLVPNKMFLNLNGNRFIDVTTASKTGNLQKGHGVSFADMDNDGDQDIHVDLGGAFVGDAYQSSFYMNPKQNDNSWICISLEGTSANRAAIGSQLKLTFTDNGLKRTVYREVNSGGSFGASPLRKEIGLGQAKKIDELVVTWNGNKRQTQVFKDVAVNQFIHLREGDPKFKNVKLKKLTFPVAEPFCEVVTEKVTYSK